MLEWVRESPASFFDYVSVGALLRLALLLVGVAGIYRYRRSRLFAEFTPGPRLILCTLGTFNLLALYAGQAESRPATNFDTPALVQMWRGLMPSVAAVSLQDRQQELDKLAFHCEPHALQSGKNANPGKRNFILFIMETLPYDVFARGHGTEFATFDEMGRSGYTALQHYSTYPFTSYARFSIFTGLYPSYRLEKTLPLGGPHPYQSFFSSLVGDGYDFKVFDPVKARYEVDDWVVKQMAGEVLDAEGGDSVQQKDELVLHKLIDNISLAAANKMPFAYAYLPQLTHGPWLPPGASKEQLYSEGLDRLKQLDKSLAAIVAALKQKGLYRETVIVVTADHGLRTRKEAGFLKTTVLNDVSYHVPMIVHDPLMNRAVTINTVTSHLDISPTLQCLYREGAPAIQTQGKVMTMTAPGKQTLFFGGAWYNGSDGMWDGKGFYSFNRQLDMVWKSERFDFDEARPLQASPLSKSVTKVFEHQGSIQEALLSH